MKKLTLWRSEMAVTMSIWFNLRISVLELWVRKETKLLSSVTTLFLTSKGSTGLCSGTVDNLEPRLWHSWFPWISSKDLSSQAPCSSPNSTMASVDLLYSMTFTTLCLTFGSQLSHAPLLFGQTKMSVSISECTKKTQLKKCPIQTKNTVLSLLKSSHSIRYLTRMSG